MNHNSLTTQVQLIKNKRRNLMSNKKLLGKRGNWSPQQILDDIVLSFKMFRDPKVALFLKLCLPIFAFIYWVSPVDLLVGLPFDDIGILVIATRMFVAFSPQEAVARARK